MPTIRLYKTKLDQSNRMGTFEEYQSYIDSLPYQEVEIKQPFVEKNNHMYIKYFNDELENGSYDLYNYALIDGVVGDVIPAFVKLSPLATEGYRVDVSVDYWLKYLRFKHFGVNIDLHGKCIRANVNEWEEYNSETKTFSKPTLKNTYLTQEENVSISDMERGTIENETINLPKNYAYIYVYFNNPRQQNLSYSVRGNISNLTDVFAGSQYILEPQLDKKQPKSLQGALACGTINLKTGFCCFTGKISNGSSYVDVIGDILSSCCYLRDLTNSYITTIYISNVAPYDISSSTQINVSTISFEIPSVGRYEEVVYYPSYDEDYCFLLDYASSSDNSMPHFMFCPSKIDSSIKVGKLDIINSNANCVWKDETLYKNDENYLKSVVKARSFIYNPISYIGTVFDTLHDREIEVSLSADGSQFIATIDSDLLLSNERVIRSQNSLLFTPDTVKDYWSILNAERTSYALKTTRTEAVFNAITGTFDSALGGISGGQGIASGASAGGGAGAAAIAIGAVQLASNLTKNVQAITKTVQTFNLTDYDKQFAEAQKQNGVVSSSVPTGYYGTPLYGHSTTLSYAKLSNKSLDTVTEQLHRYGYATFLLLEDVLENHKREKFNYIQASQVELHGCDTDLAQDIISMFQNGVHLWHTNDVGNYNTTNYQVNV